MSKEIPPEKPKIKFRKVAEVTLSVGGKPLALALGENGTAICTHMAAGTPGETVGSITGPDGSDWTLALCPGCLANYGGQQN